MSTETASTTAPVQPIVHVYRPSSLLGRAVRTCTTCRCRRRFIVRVYGWYASRWTCGGCGYVWSEGRERTGTKERAQNRRFVRESWPRAMVHSDAIREILKIT